MTILHICPLDDVAAVIRHHAPSHALSLIRRRDGLALPQPLASTRHLHLAIDDIEVAQAPYLLPQVEDVQRIIMFFDEARGAGHVLVHCWQGISRSSAAALIGLAMCVPGQEDVQARRLFQCMPFARPNRRLLALADALLQRDGRLAAMSDCFDHGGTVPMGRPVSLTMQLDAA